MSVEIGQNLSHYQVLEKLGEGGMGVVYKAQDNKLKRLVALKFLPSLLIKDESTRKRFTIEAQAASALDHPNICTIHEINETEDDQLYICMAYYEGESLRQKIKKGPITFEESLDIFYQIAQGLKTAHEEQIIHRDIKPGNIIITNKGEIKIVDFGLAKLAGEKITESISTKGTIAYMSPEVIRGLPEDHRTDLWSLGVVFYEMLTGHLPFRGEYPEPLMYSILNEDPKPLSHYMNNVHEILEDIIGKLLKKDPLKRCKEISELLIDIEPLIAMGSIASIKTKPETIKSHLRKKALERSQGNSIAVLPLDNITNDAEQEWLTDGITDALITELAQISRMRVISRSSSMRFKGTTKSPPEIGEELGVHYLVDGSLVEFDNSIKISVRLIKAPDDEYVWAQQYDRKFKNILSLQSEIAKSIASQLKVKLTPEEEAHLAAPREVNPETYELYMKGMFHLNKLTPEGIGKGLTYLHQAVDQDPKEPLAHAALAIAYNLIAHGASPIPDALSRAKAATLKAIELDESLAEAHLALTMVKTFDELDWVAAAHSNKRTLELNPNLALAHYWNGYLLRIPGNLEEGYAEMIRAKQLDPLNPVYPADLGTMYYQDGNIDESINECLKSLEINPAFPQAYHILGCAYAVKEMYEEAITANKKAGESSLDWKWGLGHTYALIGEREKALAVIAELEAQPMVWYYWGIAEIYSGLGDNDKAIQWLEKCYQHHHPFIQWIRRYRNFESLKNDPRFIDLSRRLNLPE